MVECLPVGDDAFNAIIGWEVSSREAYEHLYAAPTWPGGASGLTIGIGYDLGYERDVDAIRDWIGMPANALHRLTAACGVRGLPAKHFVVGLHDVRVPWAMALDVHRRLVLPRYIRMTMEALPNCELLSPNSFGALVSLVYNRGPAFDSNDDRHLEMRAIKSAMVLKNFGLIPGLFRKMERLWLGGPDAGLASRREGEARLFERGLVPIAAAEASPAETSEADALMAAEMAAVEASRAS